MKRSSLRFQAPGWSLPVAALSLLGAHEAALAQWSPPPRHDFTFFWGVLTADSALPEGVDENDPNPYNLPVHTISRACVFLTANKVGIYPEPGPHEIGMTPGYMEAHLADLRLDIDRWIPDPDFDGPVVIDFEDWYLNWERTKDDPSTAGPLAEDTDFLQDWQEYIRAYQPASLEGLSEEQVQVSLQQSYEAAGLDFYLVTLAECKRLRPHAQWGFYNYPPKRYYSMEVPRATPRIIGYGDHSHLASQLNDRLAPLWEQSVALFPSTYCNRVTVANNVTPDTDLRQNNIADDRLYIRSCIEEAHRLANGKPVYTVFWSRYQNCGTMSDELINTINIRNQCEVALAAGASGAMVWDGVAFQSEFQEMYDWFQTPCRVRMNQVLTLRPPPPLPPLCGDWNADSGVDSQDLFDFLEAFFIGAADYNRADGTDSQDYFDFAEAFLNGCP